MRAHERRRLVLAATVTVVAFPAMWLLDRDDASDSADATVRTLADPALPTVTDELGVPVFLDNTTPVVAPAVIDIAVPQAAGPREARGDATFRRYVEPPVERPCTTLLAPLGALLTVTNIDNGLSTTCTNTRSLAVQPGAEITIDTAVYVTIAELVEADAMRLDWDELLCGSSQWTLVANLPYNVATPLVCDLLDHVPAITKMLVMVQREVAERLAAPARTDAFGAVSVKVAYWATARVAGLVPASVFRPRPNVESALVEIVRREAPAVHVDPVPLFHLVRTAFGHRRKMLRRSLTGLVEPATFECAGIDSQRRPEELGVEEWGRLTTAWLDQPAGGVDAR